MTSISHKMEWCQRTCQRKSHLESNCYSECLWLDRMFVSTICHERNINMQQKFYKPSQKMENENAVTVAQSQVTGSLRTECWASALGCGHYEPTSGSAALLPTSGSRCGWQAAGSDTRAAPGPGGWWSWNEPANSSCPGCRNCRHSHHCGTV